MVWGVFGLVEKSLESAPLADAEILALMEEREAARKRRDFRRSDEIRDVLKQRGIELLDGKDGVRWRRIANAPWEMNG